MKKLLLAFFLLFSVTVYAQDLNAHVQILSPKIQSPNKRVFQTLENAIQDFLNSRRWASEALQTQERIDCNFIITINEWNGASNFKAEAQIQSSRPVYGTTYNSTILNINDKDFDFNYAEGQPLDFSDQNHTQNLTAILAYYAYIITGLDYDTFSKLGGSPYFAKAQTVVNNAQNISGKGWKAFEGFRNRYWLAENLSNKSYNTVRESLYEYHRNGLDLMAENQAKAKKNILTTLTQLAKTDRQKQGSMLPQLFFTAKADEMVNLLSTAAAADKQKAYSILTSMDPANANKYEILKKR